jgi:hypothetical protein
MKGIGAAWWEPPASAGGSWTSVQREKVNLKWALAPENAFRRNFLLAFEGDTASAMPQRWLQNAGSIPEGTRVLSGLNENQKLMTARLKPRPFQ